MLVRPLIVVAALGTLTSPVAAQSCDLQWGAGSYADGLPGAASAILPDGGDAFIVAGQIRKVNGAAADLIMRWTGSTWQEMAFDVGGDQSAIINDLVRMPNGDVIAVGEFATVNGITMNSIAKWNGSTWQPLGTGLRNFANPNQSFRAVVRDAHVTSAGELIVVGQFTVAGSVTAYCIAKWNGSAWSALGAPQFASSADIKAVTQRSNGDIFIGGSLVTQSGPVLNRVARWNGSAFENLGAGITSGDVNTIACANNGDLYVGGSFSNAGPLTGVNNIARWDGSAWSRFNNGVAHSAIWPSVNDLVPLADGSVLALGRFNIATPNIRSLSMVRCNSTSWVGTYSSGPRSSIVFDSTDSWAETYAGAQLPDGSIIVAGIFGVVGNSTLASGIAKLSPNNTWTAYAGNSFDGTVRASARMPNGDVIVAGEFTRAAGLASPYIARRTSSGWVSMPSPGGAISALAVAANGDIYAGGLSPFTLSGTATPQSVVRWDGTMWQPVASATNVPAAFSPPYISAIAISATGELTISGTFNHVDGVPADRIAKRVNGAWQALTPQLAFASTNSVPQAMGYTATGDLIVVGRFGATAGGTSFAHVARYRNNAWDTMQTGAGGANINARFSLLITPDDTIYTGGYFQMVTRYTDATGWETLAVDASSNFQSVLSLSQLPNGDLIAAGTFSTISSTTASRIARFDGTQWHPIASGISSGVVYTSALGNAGLVLGGTFALANNNTSPFVATLIVGACCDDIDFNNNGVFPEDQDITDFFSVLAGAQCGECHDIDFNNNGVFPEDQDVIDFFNVLAGGSCV